jgi:hypothetical protein
MAARLANEHCFRVFDARPFRPATYPAHLEGERWVWGRLEPIGRASGYSAVVSFGRSGSHPKVEVFLTTDVPDEAVDQ